MIISKVQLRDRCKGVEIGKTISEFKCLECEHITHLRAQMMEHQLSAHAWFFREEIKPDTISQLGHIHWFVKILDYAGRVWETRSTRIDPNEEKLPTGNLNDESLMPFGKHKGTKLTEVPLEYLNWIYNNTEKKPFNRGVFTYITNNLKELRLKDLNLEWKTK